MAEKNNAACSICGKGYYKCLSCQADIKSAPWKMYTDTSEHYKVFQVLHGFSTGVYTKAEAKSKLKKVDLSDLSDFRDHIKIAIEDIMKEGQKSVVVKTNENSASDSLDAEAMPKIRRKKISEVVEAE